MNTTTKIVLAFIVGIIGGAGVAMAITSTDAREDGETASMGHMMTGGRSTGMQASMDSMSASLTGKTGDAFDKEFLTQMTLHHQGAVRMAQAALVSAKHPEIKTLAQNIITAQNKEIAEMKSWQAMWNGSAAASSTSMHTGTPVQ